MNILIFSWRGPGHPLAGGAEIATWHHATAWQKAGHSVTLFTSAFVGAAPDETIDGICIHRRSFQFGGVQIAGFFWYLFGSHKKYDLVMDEFHGLPFFTPLYVRVKKLAFIHEVAREVWALNPWPFPFNLIPAFFGRLFEPFIFKLFYLNVPFMTVSESTACDLNALGVKNVTVVHNGVNLISPLPNDPKPKQLTLIFLSALAKDKGPEDAIKAFAIIHSKIPSARMWLVGKGNPDYVDYLKKLASSDSVTFFGFVPQSQKFKLLSQAHLMLNTSFHEGWGLVNIEANSVRTPVVGYFASGTKDSVVHNKTGVLVPRGDFMQLADEVLKLWQDKTRYNLLSNNAQKWSTNFSWNKSTTVSKKIIDQL